MKNQKTIVQVTCIIAALLLFKQTESLAQLKAAFGASATAGCAPVLVQFADSSQGAPTSWFWDLGNGNTSVQQNPGAIYTNPGTYTVKLVVQNASGTDTVVKVGYITVYTKPIVDFQFSPSSGCLPLGVTFTDKTVDSAAISQWKWDFGDGQGSANKNPYHVYTVSGDFSVTLTATNVNGCSAYLQKQSIINANGIINTNFNYTYVNACSVPSAITFANTTTTTTAVSYQWLFGDGGSSSNANPVYTYTAAGNYNVQLIASASNGCADTIVKPISIGSVKPNFLIPAQSCTNAVIIFSDSSSPKPIFETWYFGDGTQAVGAVQAHQYTAPGNYPVKLVANFGTCTDSITQIFTVSNKPTASFSSTGTNKSCALPGVVQFQNTSTGAVSYYWDFGDGSNSTLTSPSHTYTTAGIYNVMLVAQNAGGCSDTLIANNYVELGPPQIDSLLNAPYSGCAPKTFTLGAVVSSGDSVNSYTWNFGDGSPVQFGANPTHTFTAGGVYNVTLWVSTVSGCTDSAVFKYAVTLGHRPTAKFTASPLVTCASSPVQFTDESTGAITNWAWSFGDKGTSSQSSPSYKYTDTGYFNVKLVVSSYGCLDSSVQTKYIYVNPPIARFNYTYQCGQKLLRNFVDSSIGAKTWNWSFGDGASSTLQNPQHTYATSGEYFVTLTVTNGSCSDNKTDTVFIVDQTPTFAFSPKDTMCEGVPVRFTAVKYNSATLNSLYWNFGDGTSAIFYDNTPGVDHPYDHSGVYKPYLVIQDITGCNDTITRPGLKMTVFGPTPYFANTNGTCVNKAVTFTDESATDGLHSLKKWIWAYGDGKTDTLTGPPFSHVYDSTGTFAVTLTVTDSYGCSGTITKYNTDTITKPVAAFGLNGNIKCLGSQVAFIDSSIGVGLTYAWTLGDGGTSTVAAPTHTYKSQGTYTVSLAVEDKFGCTDTLTRKNYLNITDPIAQFTVADTFGVCPPLVIHPINTSLNNTSLTWDFGDGSTSLLSDPEHTYTVAGVYKLLLKVQGYGNCTDTVSKSIVLYGPSGNLAFTPTDICKGSKVDFTVTSPNNIAGYSWDFGDGGTAVTLRGGFNYIYGSPGQFFPKVIIVDSTGNCHVTLQNLTQPVQVAKVNASFSAVAAQGCDSAMVTFANNSIVLFDSLTSRTWSFGDGSTSSVGSPVHYYSTSGNETVVLTLVSSFGCSSSDTVSINATVNQSPVISATIPASVCASSPANFSASNSSAAAGAVNWGWQFGDGDSSVAQNPAYTYAVSGTYNVSVTATNQFGCQDSINGTITAQPLPIPAIQAVTDSTICLGQSTTLVPSGASTYSWTPNSFLSCTACANVVATPDSTTTFSVLATSTNGCTALDSIQITVERPFKLTVPLADTICAGLSVQLNASGGQVYDWNPSTGLSNPGIANPVATPALNTTYYVVATDTKKCYFDTAQVPVTVIANPTVKIADTAVSILGGASYQPLSTSSADVVMWNWWPQAGVSCYNCAQPSLAPNITTRYEEKVLNQFGCSASAFITVTVLCDNNSLFIPNTFSPNGDGMNDYFYPRGAGLYSIKAMRIFNRWGQPVFERLNFPANDAASGWDGKFNGQPQPADVYVYVIEVYCTNGTVLTSKGDITLLR